MALPRADEEWFANVLWFQYVMLSAFCIGVYDWLLTLDAEIELVWSTKWNFVTLLWALFKGASSQTHHTALSLISRHSEVCGVYALIAGALIALTVLLCHGAFALRTSALYSHDARVRGLLGGLLVAEAGTLSFAIVRSLQLARHADAHPRLHLRGCLSGVPDNAFGILTCSVPFAYDAVIFALTLARSIAFIRRNAGAPVVPVLLRDGVGYFTVILACYLANTLMFIYGKVGAHTLREKCDSRGRSIQTNQKVITTGFSIMIPVVITLRLMLNLRGCAVSQPSSKDDLAAGEDGAGPAGLATALSLRVQGVSVTLVDAAERPGIGSRAAVIHAASLEELSTLGLSSTLLKEGIVSHEFAFRDAEDKSLMTIDFRIIKDVTDFPMVLLIAQDIVERVMTERLLELGVSIFRNKTVTRMHDVTTGGRGDAGGMKVAFRTGEVMMARTVVGADGSRSMIRALAGIRFIDPHTKLEPAPSPTVVQLVLADILLYGPLPASFSTTRPSSIFGDDGMVILYPLKNPPDSPDNTFFFRFIGSLTTEDPEPPSTPSVTYIQNLLDARGPGSRTGRPTQRVAAVLTGSRYRTRSAIADDFCRLPPRQGRGGAVVLVGDSAHVHSPAGGQGMNLGICDGVRLGRALAAGTRSALWTYARDRKSAAIRGVELAERLMEFANVRGSWALGIRNAAMRAMMKFPGRARSFALRMSGLADPNDIRPW
ncbi:FAD/NAD(P)-binding domain-containing protein [Auricularia subglabra TFB-10046 SS5]|nr:FAD/NAD(P)-binding domain-containing protein [Auricularia subglabra TFB-10046 SS5]